MSPTTGSAALLALALLAPSCDGGPGRPERGPPSAAEAVVGTWLGTYEVDAPDFPRTAFVRTYHADGTGTAVSERLFGAGDAGRFGLSSPQHIRWEERGPRTIAWRLLHFGYDTTGRLTYISRSHGVVEYDADFEEGRGKLTVEIFEPAALLDPLAPNDRDAVPSFTATGTTVARRLRVGAS